MVRVQVRARVVRVGKVGTSYSDPNPNPNPKPDPDPNLEGGAGRLPLTMEDVEWVKHVRLEAADVVGAESAEVERMGGAGMYASEVNLARVRVRIRIRVRARVRVRVGLRVRARVRAWVRATVRTPNLPYTHLTLTSHPPHTNLTPTPHYSHLTLLQARRPRSVSLRSTSSHYGTRSNHHPHPNPRPNPNPEPDPNPNP